MSKNHYRADFDGVTVTRSTGRAYTHAWGVRYNDRDHPMGFSGSAELARKAAAAHVAHILRWGKRESVPVVVPAVPITSAEARALKQAEKEARA